MCIIPYGTQEGEISFCAYNTGVGWRNIIENMYQNASVGEWYKKNGRHTVYAGGKEVKLDDFDHSLKVEEKWAVSKPETENPETTKSAAEKTAIKEEEVPKSKDAVVA